MKRFENINLAESHCIAIDRFNRCDFLPSSLFCLLPSLFHLSPLINDPFQTLKQLCIVPKNPLISRFLSRVNFFKKPVWRKCVPRYLVYPILRLSLDGWLLWKKKKKRKEGSRIHRGKIIGRYIKEIWFVGWNYSVISSSPLFLSLSLSTIFIPSFLSQSYFIGADIWNATTFDRARFEIFLTVPFGDIRSTTTTTTIVS